jgi:formate dehydrogenase beta subunit
MPASTSARWTASPSPPNGDEADLRGRLKAPARNTWRRTCTCRPLKTGRVMVKDEDVCLHCGLCAERCPTGAWDMQKFLLLTTKAGPGCRAPGAPPHACPMAA